MQMSVLTGLKRLRLRLLCLLRGVFDRNKQVFITAIPKRCGRIFRAGERHIARGPSSDPAVGVHVLEHIVPGKRKFEGKKDRERGRGNGGECEEGRWEGMTFYSTMRVMDVLCVLCRPCTNELKEFVPIRG